MILKIHTHASEGVRPTLWRKLVVPSSTSLESSDLSEKMFTQFLRPDISGLKELTLRQLQRILFFFFFLNIITIEANTKVVES